MRFLVFALAGNLLAVQGAVAQEAEVQPSPVPNPPQGVAQVPLPPIPDFDGQEPIVPDDDFVKALPQLSDDLNAPLEAMEQGAPIETLPPIETLAPIEEIAEALPLDEQGAESEIASNLPKLSEFDPTLDAQDVASSDGSAVEIRYVAQVTGLDAVGLESLYNQLSALKDGDGVAGNAAVIEARAREDEGLAVRLMKSVGYYDATATSKIEQTPQGSKPVTVTVVAVPGPLYTLGAVRVQADPTVPPGLIMDTLKLQSGEPIDAANILAAEALVTLTLPRKGYPFAEVGQRDILLDDKSHTGDYTLPVTIGPRARFRSIVPEGDAVFDSEHIGVLARFERDDLFDGESVDDLRDALIATSLFSNVTVEPVRTGEVAGEGTEYVDLRVRQVAGPPRTLAAEAGYSTGQGLRAEVSWTHRNFFPPEGALIATGVAGTQEQGASATFRRSNWRKRDQTLTGVASVLRTDVDAFTSLTGTLAARISYDSTPLWQKKLTYGAGVELVATSEDRYDFAASARRRGIYFIGAVPLFVGFDQSNDLLNPTTGWRVKLDVSPETSVRGSVRPYARVRAEATGYYPVMDNLVIAGRVRVGSIQGVDRNDLAPSRRYYGGGGGSVRGFGYQDLGPRAPDGKPIGGRSFNEFALEARYRFGDFGIVPFIDAGQVYEETMPKFTRMRFGAGIGGRFYTNFGPMRLDVATPIGRKEGEPKIALYISIGQAF